MDTSGLTPNIVYASRGAIQLRADLTRPKTQEGGSPLLVTLPGGAWRQANKGNHRGWAQHLAARGYAVFTPEYRVANAQTKAFPEAVHDAIAAIRFARSHAAEFGVNPDRIGLLGSSAGAHLAALAALAPEKFKDESDPNSNVSADVKMLVCVYGVYDLFAHWQADLANNPAVGGNLVGNFLQADPFENQQLYFDASPIRHINYSKNRLPVFMAWGTNDDAVLPSQSESFLKALMQARFDVRAHRAIGASHFWFNQSPDIPETDSAWLSPRLLAFLAANL